MFELPSLANIIISTLVFIIAAWYLRRYFDEQDMPAGMTRSLLIFVLAYILSWGAGEIVDWAQVKLYGEQAAQGQDLLKMMQELQQPKEL